MELLEKLEAEHGPLTLRVATLRALFLAVSAGERQVLTVLGELREHLAWLHDELLDHFGREEEFYFPYLRGALPELSVEVDRLEASHDQICGALSQLQHLAARGGRRFEESFEHLAHVFVRFADTYSEHAAHEREILRDATARLTDDERRALAEAAAGIV